MTFSPHIRNSKLAHLEKISNNTGSTRYNTGSMYRSEVKVQEIRVNAGMYVTHPSDIKNTYGEHAPSPQTITTICIITKFVKRNKS